MPASSSSNAASDQNKRQNEMKQQTTNPGEHVILEKVKTCHQCHQHSSLATACRNQRKKRPCTLLYGEKAEEADASEVWSCPKCRDICNCSICRAKRGHLPTGNLCRKAKAAGYSSVSQLLQAKGPENFGLVKNGNDSGASQKKRRVSKKEIATPGEKANEIVVVEGTVLDVQPLTAIPFQQSTMEEPNYPSEEMMEEVDKTDEDLSMEDVEFSPFLDPGIPISTPQYTAAGKKMLTYHTFSDSSEKKKATEEEIARANQQFDEEANETKIDDLVALRNDVDKLSTKIAGIEENVAITGYDVNNISENVKNQATNSYADHQDLLKKVNLLQQSHDSCRETQLHILRLVMEISNQLGISVDEVEKGEKKLGEASCRVEADQKKDDGDDSDQDKDDGNGGDKPVPVEKINALKPSYKSAQEFQASDQRGHSGLGLAKAKMGESDNFRLGDDPAPLYDSLLEPLSQKHLDKVETAVVVHTLWNGEVTGEMLIYFLKDGRTMKINQVQLLLFKEQLELEYLVHIMHARSIVHRRWIENMKTKIRQITKLPTGSKEYFRPKYVCDKDGKEKEMPHGSVKIQHDQLGSYMEYTKSQVGMSSITLDDVNDYDYSPSELRAAYWQISGADDESVKIKRKLKKALENAEFKLLDKFLQKNPSFSEIPDGYEWEY